MTTAPVKTRSAPARCLILALIAGAAGVVATSSPAQAQPASQPCNARTFEGTAFTVCTYGRAADEVRLALDGPQGPLGGFGALARSLGADAGRVLFAMNAGMFEPDRAPVGLLVQAGRTMHAANTAKGRGNFFLAPNGVFFVDPDGGAHIEETGAYLAAGHAPAWATQSGPLLLNHGQMHPAIAPDGSSQLIRNGVGLSGPQEAWFVISDQPVSFGRFTRFFRDALGCTDALYLDGTVSKLWAPNLGRRDAASDLGPLIVVLRKASAKTPGGAGGS